MLYYFYRISRLPGIKHKNFLTKYYSIIILVLFSIYKAKKTVNTIKYNVYIQDETDQSSNSFWILAVHDIGCDRK